jgi:acetoin utilization protein AcuB
MFSIYGISGPIFQGTLENLSRLPPVVRRGPINATRRLSDQDAIDSAGEEFVGQTSSGTGAQAIDAYQSMLPKELERGPLYHANQIMQPQVITVSADDDVSHAWRTLVGNQIHQAPVLDAGYRLVGILSEHNLLTALNVDGDGVRDVLFKKVGDVMTTPVVAATLSTDIRRIAHVMLERDVDGVPIINETGSLVGFISRSDILRAVVTDPPLSVWR